MISSSEQYREIIKSIDKKQDQIKVVCNKLIFAYRAGHKMSHRDYIYTVLALDVHSRVKDLIVLHKQHVYDKDGFDSSIFLISRSVVESYIYLKYLLSENTKITMRLEAFICHSTKENELKIFKSLMELGTRKKFVFDSDENAFLSEKMIQLKIDEWQSDIISFKSRNSKEEFDNEIDTLKYVWKVSKMYDVVMGINSVEAGEENKSMEWIYNYVYRFQCMSGHQSLRDKEKIFDQVEKAPDNKAVLELMLDLTSDILNLYES